MTEQGTALSRRPRIQIYSRRKIRGEVMNYVGIRILYISPNVRNVLIHLARTTEYPAVDPLMLLALVRRSTMWSIL